MFELGCYAKEGLNCSVAWCLFMQANKSWWPPWNRVIRELSLESQSFSLLVGHHHHYVGFKVVVQSFHGWPAFSLALLHLALSSRLVQHLQAVAFLSTQSSAMGVGPLTITLAHLLTQFASSFLSTWPNHLSLWLLSTIPIPSSLTLLLKEDNNRLIHFILL